MHVVEPPGYHRVHSVKPTRSMTTNQKYNKMFALCQRIAESISDKGTRAFDGWFSHLEGVERAARDDLSPSVSQPLDTYQQGKYRNDDVEDDNIGDAVDAVETADGSTCDVVGGSIGDAVGDAVGDTIGDAVGDASDASKKDDGTNLNKASHVSSHPRTTRVAAKAKNARLLQESKNLADCLQGRSDFTL